MDVQQSLQTGGGGEYLKLGNIGNANEVSDLYTISSATIVGINSAIALARFGNIGGITLNSFFDLFGLEGYLSTMFLVLIFIQITRWFYTKFYTAGGLREWSPVVFVCILLATQVVSDLIFYFGLLNQVPYGQNTLLDSIKNYVKEHGAQAMGGHAAFLILISTLAMIFKEVSPAIILFITCLSLYLLPYLLSVVSKYSKAARAAEEAAAAAQKAKVASPKNEGFHQGGGGWSPGF